MAIWDLCSLTILLFALTLHKGFFFFFLINEDLQTEVLTRKQSYLDSCIHKHVLSVWSWDSCVLPLGDQCDGSLSCYFGV